MPCHARVSSALRVRGWKRDLHTRHLGYRKEEAREPCEGGPLELDVLFDHAGQRPAVVVLRKLSVSPEVIWVPIDGTVPV